MVGHVVTPVVGLSHVASSGSVLEKRGVEEGMCVNEGETLRFGNCNWGNWCGVCEGGGRACARRERCAEQGDACLAKDLCFDVVAFCGTWRP